MSLQPTLSSLAFFNYLKRLLLYFVYNLQTTMTSSLGIVVGLLEAFFLLLALCLILGKAFLHFVCLFVCLLLMLGVIYSSTFLVGTFKKLGGIQPSRKKVVRFWPFTSSQMLCCRQGKVATLILLARQVLIAHLGLFYAISKYSSSNMGLHFTM